MTLPPCAPDCLRLLGIDPGLRITGYGVVDLIQGQCHYVASGVVRTTTEAPLATRLHTLFASVVELCAQYQPQVAVVEKVFVNVNPQSTLLLGHARGAVLTALSHGGNGGKDGGVAIVEYTALQIKQAVVGHGKAQKHQVQEMVKRLLKLPAAPSTDAADALAAALTHAQCYGLVNVLVAKAPAHSAFRTRKRKGRLGWS